MVFFKSVLKAFRWLVLIGFAALLVDLVGIHLFSARILTIPGVLLAYFFLLGAVLYIDY